MKLRSEILAFLLLCSLAHRGYADECDMKVAEIVSSEVGVSATRNTPPQIDLAKIESPFTSEASIDCPTDTGFPIDLFVNWDGAYPPKSFYDFAGRVGHVVVGAPEADIRDGAMLCQRKALGSEDETAHLMHGGAYFECQAFSRDGGGTAISIYNRKDVPRDLYDH